MTSMEPLITSTFWLGCLIAAGFAMIAVFIAVQNDPQSWFGIISNNREIPTRNGVILAVKTAQVCLLWMLFTFVVLVGGTAVYAVITRAFF